MMSRTALVCHQATPTLLVRRIEAIVRGAKAGAIELSYILEADLPRLRIPPPGPTRRSDRLWEHTCFEAFVMVKGGPGYLEFNLAPSSEWAAYHFIGYRQEAALTQEVGASIEVRELEGRLELDAVIRAPSMMPIADRSQLRLGLSAVVEEAGGALSYWALRHPANEPDFHHPDSFALAI